MSHYDSFIFSPLGFEMTPGDYSRVKAFGTTRRLLFVRGCAPRRESLFMSLIFVESWITRAWLRHVSTVLVRLFSQSSLTTQGESHCCAQNRAPLSSRYSDSKTLREERDRVMFFYIIMRGNTAWSFTTLPFAAVWLHRRVEPCVSRFVYKVTFF